MLNTILFAMRFYSFFFVFGLISSLIGIYELSQPSIQDQNLPVIAPNYDVIWLGITVVGLLMLSHSLRKAVQERADIKKGVMSEIMKG